MELEFMKKELMKLGLIFSAFVSINSLAESFILNGQTVNSTISTNTIECQGFTIAITENKFPVAYEMQIPKKFRIAGFNGSPLIIGKYATLQPSGLQIPSPQDISLLKGQLPKERTYLPTTATCKGSRIIVSYWSGGNCKTCETFMAFNVEDDQIIPLKKVDYSEMRALSE